EMLVLIISGIFGLLFAWKLFRWEKDEPIRRSRKFMAMAFVIPFIVMGLWMNTRANPAAGWDMALKMASGKTPEKSASQSGLVSDFDDGAVSARFGSGWSVSTDSLMGGKSTAQIKVVEGGVEGSKGSLLISGHVAGEGGFSWAGAMFSPGEKPFTPADISSFKAVSFWAKGDGQTYTLMMFSSNLGPIPAMNSFTAGPDWKQYTFPLSSFRGLDPHSIEGVLFAATSGPGDFKFQIDGVKFE
ncbi:MAG: CIA30 family protein, partial [Acidobacteriota bacterium]|nr:CIA30 family protein [Acidobacteriota bacterium]